MAEETPGDETGARDASGQGVGEFERLVRDVEADAGCADFPRLAEAYRRAGQIARAREIAEAGLALAPERLVGRVVLALAQLEDGDVSTAMDGLASILENVPAVSNDSDSGTDDAVSEHRLYAPALARPSAQLPKVELGRQGDDSSVDLREDEIDDAFDHAHAEADPLLDPNDVAEAAMLDADIPETTADDASTGPRADVFGDEDDDGDDANEPYRPVEHPVFATETMASLLEGQGDVAAAAAIRSWMPKVSSVPFETAHDEPAAARSDDSSDELDVATDEVVVNDIQSARDQRRARIVSRLEGWLANIRRDVA